MNCSNRCSRPRFSLYYLQMHCNFFIPSCLSDLHLLKVGGTFTSDFILLLTSLKAIYSWKREKIARWRQSGWNFSFVGMGHNKSENRSADHHHLSPVCSRVPPRTRDDYPFFTNRSEFALWFASPSNLDGSVVVGILISPIRIYRFRLIWPLRHHKHQMLPSDPTLTQNFSILTFHFTIIC